MKYQIHEPYCLPVDIDEEPKEQDHVCELAIVMNKLWFFLLRDYDLNQHAKNGSINKVRRKTHSIAGLRLLCFLWATRPELFNGAPLSSIAKQLHVRPKVMYKYVTQFRRTFAFRTRVMRPHHQKVECANAAFRLRIPIESGD